MINGDSISYNLMIVKKAMDLILNQDNTQLGARLDCQTGLDVYLRVRLSLNVLKHSEREIMKDMALKGADFFSKSTDVVDKLCERISTEISSISINRDAKE